MTKKYTFYINGRNSNWNFVNIIRDLLRKDPNWEEIDDPSSVELLHYSDRDGHKPLIQNYISAHPQFVEKDYMAQTLAKSSHIPLTLVIKNKRITKTVHRMTNVKRNGKWFLKPSNGYGGKDISVFMGLHNYRNFIVTNNRYVLQQEVSNPILYDGRKFDLRSFVALIYRNNKYHVYLYPDGICRVSLTKYNRNRSNRGADLTNCTVQEKSPGYRTDKINKLTSEMPWYNDILPKLEHVVACILKKMKKALKRPKNRDVVEVIAFDSIISKYKNKNKVTLIEINRNVGFGYNRKPSYVVDIYKKMYRDLITFAYIPIINKTKLNKPEYWIKCTTL